MSKKRNCLKTKMISVRLDLQSIEILKRLSEENNKSMSLIISELIKKEVKNEIFNWNKS